METARSYLHTPHLNGGMVKGAGVDCCTLPVLIFKEMGIADIPIKTKYTGDWFCQKNCQEIMLPYLTEYFARVENLEPGDLVSFRWGRSQYAHIALFLGNNRYIHAHADNGVEIVAGDCPYFFDKTGKTRITGFWRVIK